MGTARTVDESACAGPVVGRTIHESTPHFVNPPHPWGWAPNVVIVLLDDTGFAQLGCYGSTIDTPNMNRLAADGVQFTNFHVTPLCSPTRASLLTGRDAHAGPIQFPEAGFEHQLGHLSERACTIAEVLQSNGYATFCSGKWHLAPMDQCLQRVPLIIGRSGRGFSRPFLWVSEGETDQFHPQLIGQPPGRSARLRQRRASPHRGSRRSDVVDDHRFEGRATATWLGATHAPHQAPQAVLGKVPLRVRRGVGRYAPAVV